MVKEKIEKFLRDCKKLCFLCLGNVLRKDDGIGIEIGKELKRFFENTFICEMDPTSYLFKILKEKFSHVIIIDCVDAGEKPGEIFFLEKVPEGNPFTTHDISLAFIINFLKRNNVKAAIVGIQPKDVGFGVGISKEVRKSSERLIKMLKEIILRMNR